MRLLQSEKHFPWRIFYRVALIQSALVLVALATSGLTARYFFKRQFIQQAKSQLQDALLLLSHASLPENPFDEHWCGARAKNTALRFALILRDGRVACDSRESAEALPNQASRPEVVAGFKQPAGSPIHFTVDSSEEMLYGTVAVRPQEVILRGAVPLTRLSQTMQVFDTSLGLSLLFAAIALGVLAFWSARRLVFPLGRLLVKTRNMVTAQAAAEILRDDLSHESFDEWADLESNIDDIRRDLAAKTQSLSMEQVELETIMGSISDAILAVDPDGNPLFFNSRFELLFGKEGLRGNRNIKLWAIFREPEILNAFQEALKEGRVTDTKAIPLDQKEGPRRFFSLSVSPLRKKDGSIYGAVGIFHDVTELKTAEQIRIDFVANVSHELRTPLTVIKGYADTLILDSAPGSENLEYLNSIARNADRLMNLMNDLLDLSSIESDSIIQKDPLSTEEVTLRMMKQLQGAFDAKEQTVEAHFTARTVIADPSRLEQVLVNLLGNANKYTPRGGRITVSWEAEGDNVLLKVADTGPGIPIEHHGRLFERFYRIDKARSREQGGTGLGLAIVKHIMQRHEGSVWLESTTGQGSAFFCRFPGSSRGSEAKV